MRGGQIGVRPVHQNIFQGTDEDKEDQGKVNILPRERQHFNPKYFPEGLLIRYPHQRRTDRVFS